MARSIASKGGGDLITVDQYDSFDLVLDWRISRKGNSGVMYHVTEDVDRPGYSGPECQIPGQYRGRRSATGRLVLCSLRAADQFKDPATADTTKPVGEWNTMRILIDGPHVEHWMNGVKYVEYELWSDDWKPARRQNQVRQMAKVCQGEDRVHRPAGPWAERWRFGISRYG